MKIIYRGWLSEDGDETVVLRKIADDLSIRVGHVSINLGREKQALRKLEGLIDQFRIAHTKLEKEIEKLKEEGRLPF